MLPLSQLSGGPSPAASPQYLEQSRERLPLCLGAWPEEELPTGVLGASVFCPVPLHSIFSCAGFSFIRSDFLKKCKTVLGHWGPVRVQEGHGAVGLLIIHFNKNDRVQWELVCVE